MPATLPAELASLIDEARENETVDFKRQIDISNASGKEEFAVDICAIANSTNNVGYLILGVNDQKHRDKGEASVPGIDMTEAFNYKEQTTREVGRGAKLEDIRRRNENALEQMLQSIINKFCDSPFPEIRTTFYDYGDVRICVISIYPKIRPHVLIGATNVCVRHGSHKADATVREIIDMVKDRLRTELVEEAYSELASQLEDITAVDDTVRNQLALALIAKVRNLLNFRFRHNRQQLIFLMARLYFICGEFERCKESLADHVSTRTPEYLELYSRSLCRLAQIIYHPNQSIETSDPAGLAQADMLLSEAQERLQSLRHVVGDLSSYRSLLREIQDLSERISQRQQMLERKAFQPMLDLVEERYVTAAQAVRAILGTPDVEVTMATIDLTVELLNDARQVLDDAKDMSHHIPDYMIRQIEISQWINNLEHKRSRTTADYAS